MKEIFIDNLISSWTSGASTWIMHPRWLIFHMLGTHFELSSFGLIFKIFFIKKIFLYYQIKII